MVKDMGRQLRPRLRVDATAAKVIARRRGVGKIRHLDTKTLLLQRHVMERTIQLLKVHGTSIPADISTKHLDQSAMRKCLGLIGFH